MSDELELHKLLAEVLTGTSYAISTLEAGQVKAESDKACDEYIANIPLARLNTRLKKTKEHEYADKDMLSDTDYAYLKASYYKGFLCEHGVKQLLTQADIPFTYNDDQGSPHNNWWDFKLVCDYQPYYFDIKCIKREKWLNFNPFARISTPYNTKAAVTLLFVYKEELLITPAFMFTDAGVKDMLKISMKQDKAFAKYDEIMAVIDKIAHEKFASIEWNPNYERGVNVYLEPREKFGKSWQLCKSTAKLN